MSRVSITLDQFLQEQEALNRQASPPTPPCEPVMQKPTMSINAFPGTPQKPYGNMVNGCMTPPITPEGEYFMNGNELKGYHAAPRCPVTPTPAGALYIPQQQYQPYQDMTMH
jgi:hypothetical protein